MMDIVLITLLVISFAVNVFGLLYVRWILRQYNGLNEDLKDLFDSLSVYSNHVDSIYNTQMFYGDSTLENLINHTKELSQQISDYRNYLFPEEIEDYEPNYEETPQEN